MKALTLLEASKLTLQRGRFLTLLKLLVTVQLGADRLPQSLNPVNTLLIFAIAPTITEMTRTPGSHGHQTLLECSLGAIEFDLLDLDLLLLLKK